MNGLLKKTISSKLRWYVKFRIHFNKQNSRKHSNFFLNSIEPYLKYARIDEGFNSIPATQSSPDTLSFNRLLAIQRTFLNTGLKLSLFKHVNKFYNELEIKGVLDFGWANLRVDTIPSVVSSDVVEFSLNRFNTLSTGFEGYLMMPSYKNFNLTIGGQLLFNKNWTVPGETFTRN